MPVALDYARRIARNAPLAVQAAKELAIRSREMDRVTGLRVEQLVNRMLQFSDDAQGRPGGLRREAPAALHGRMTVAAGYPLDGIRVVDLSQI